MADVSDLNPAFLPLLNAYTGALGKAGIGYRVESGYRTPEQQAEIYAHSNQGQSFAAAPPWRSFHNYGLAADVIPNNPADYARMHDLARQAGLYDAQQGLGFTNYDPPHVEMPGSLSNLINQYHLAGWRPAGMPAPATGAIAYAGPSAAPSRVATTTPGTSLNSSPMDIVSTLESGNQNIAQQIKDKNTDKGTPAGGFFQIIDPTWQTYAKAAGVDVNQYPTAMSAPRNIQAQVAATIPVNQWGPNTVAALKAKFPGMDTSQTLGQWQSAALNPSGAPAAAPAAPAAVAGAGQPPPASGGLAGSLPGFQAGSPGAKMTASGLQQLAGGGATDEPPPMPLQQAQPPQAMGGPMMMRAGQQNMEPRMAAMQALAQQGFMTQPSVAAFGGGALQSPVPAAMPGGVTGMPTTGIAGTTLNSPSQLQMALMTGALSPYDMYARQAGS